MKEQPHSKNSSRYRTGRRNSYRDEWYPLEEVDTDTKTVEKGRKTSMCVIERSPESTLKRGQHITFPTKSKKMSLGTLRPLDDSLLKKLEALKPEKSPLLPGVHFTLYYDVQKSMLILHLGQAVNLSTQTPEGDSNCFCQVYLLPVKSEVQQSQCVEGTYCPIFDRVFGFGDIPLDDLRLKTLVMRFYVNHHHFVGGVLYNLKSGDLWGIRSLQR